MPGTLLEFTRSARGNVAVMVALALVPVLGLTGAAIDYSRASRSRAALQSAADASVLAAVQAGKTRKEREEIAASVFRAHMAKASAGHTFKDLSAQYSDVKDGGKVTITGKVKSLIVGAVVKGTNEDPGYMQVSVDAEAKTGGSDGVVEIALVLDNTGSMRSDMPALRAAARDLVTAVMPATGESVKMAVVPYVGAVNPGVSNLSMEWMDTNAESRWHGARLRDKRTLWLVGCDPGWVGGGDPGPRDPDHGGGGSVGGGDRKSGALDGIPGRILRELLGITSAQAQQAAPSGWTREGNCFLRTPERVNHFDLFRKLPNAPWKGCVEARPEPYDVLDTVPSRQAPNTLFVPYFWPDEPDVGVNGYRYPNNYLPEPTPPLQGYAYDGPTPDKDDGRGTSLLKYDAATRASVEDVPPFTRGPNASCPDEILPLTANQGHVLGKIAKLSHWEGGGTLSSEGLMWGWRVLSPEAPFTQGAAYGKAEKHLVIFTDGLNSAAEQEYWGFGASDYTAYGYLKENEERLGFPGKTGTYLRYKTYLDGRMAEACKNIKAKNITIHAVTFKVTDPTTEALFRSCVTDAKIHYYDAGNDGDLKKAFNAIGQAIRGSKVFISR